MKMGFNLGMARRAAVGTPTPTPSPTLNALGGTFTLAENSAEDTVAGAITGKTSGSALSLTDNAGGRVKLSGLNIVAGATATDYESATSHSFTVTETLAGATNTPRDTILTLNVTDVAEGSAALASLQALLAGNSSVVDFTTATGTTGTYNAQDLTALNNDWGQDDGGQAPALSATLGANFTVANANSTLPVTAGTYTMVVSAILDASDISSYLLAAGAGTQEVLRLIQGNGTVMPFPTEVDGVATATRGDTWAAAAIGTEVVIMVTGVDPSGSGFLSVGRPGGQTHLPGSVRRAVVIDETAVTGGDLTTARADAKTWVAE